MWGGGERDPVPRITMCGGGREEEGTLFPETEYFTGDTSTDIHSPGPTCKDYSLDLTTDVNLSTGSSELSDGSIIDAGSAFQSLTIGVWEETVLVNVSSSIRHLKWHWMMISTSLIPLKYFSIFPCSPNQNLNFLCSLFPKITFAPLPHSFLDLCSPEIYDIVPHNPWERLNVFH